MLDRVRRDRRNEVEELELELDELKKNEARSDTFSSLVLLSVVLPDAKQTAKVSNCKWFSLCFF